MLVVRDLQLGRSAAVEDKGVEKIAFQGAEVREGLYARYMASAERASL